MIGDSFTEGQGATPWFYDLEKFYDAREVKLVNLGILGTGPKQWEKLADDLTKDYNLHLHRTIINVVTIDMERDIWTFSARVLNCLYVTICDYAYGFQGYKFNTDETYDDIKRKVLKSINEIKIHNYSMNQGFNENLKSLMKKSEVIVDIYEMVRKYVLNITRQNEIALLSMSKAAEGRVFVNVVSQKTVSSANYLEYPPAKRLIEFLKINDIEHAWCDIPADGFHKNDSHPNAKGYAKLRDCTIKALDTTL